MTSRVVNPMDHISAAFDGADRCNSSGALYRGVPVSVNNSINLRLSTPVTPPAGESV